MHRRRRRNAGGYRRLPRSAFAEGARRAAAGAPRAWGQSRSTRRRSCDHPGDIENHKAVIEEIESVVIVKRAVAFQRTVEPEGGAGSRDEMKAAAQGKLKHRVFRAGLRRDDEGIS